MKNIGEYNKRLDFALSELFETFPITDNDLIFVIRTDGEYLFSAMKGTADVLSDSLNTLCLKNEDIKDAILRVALSFELEQKKDN